MADMVQPERVTVTVNDREIEVQSGLNILQALGNEGISIPSLCNDVRLKRANGSCGMCVVEVGSCLLYTSPSPRDRQKSRMPSSA